MGSTFRFGSFELRPAERALLADGEPVRLGGRAFDILLALVERRDRVVGFDELLDVVWPGLAVEENNLSVQVSTLRKVLGSAAITTVRGKGFRFTSPTQVSAVSEASPPSWTSVWPPSGAVVCVRDAIGRACGDAPLEAWWASLGGREVATGPAVGVRGIAFDRLRMAARAALRARLAGSDSDGPPCIGMASIDHGKGAATGDADDAIHRAAALAVAALPGEILLTAELASEFIPGVDGEVDDLGDLVVAGRPLRTLRVRHATTTGTPPAERTAPSRLRPGIAVLPFDGPCTDDAEDLMGEALAEDVIAALSQLAGFTVISGLSSRRLRRCGLAPSRMAGFLDAEFLLTGSYRQSAGRIVLRVQLQAVHRGEVLCAIEADADASQAFGGDETIGARIAEQVVQAVSARAVALSRTRPLPELDSYALLMGAVGLMHRASPQEFERARAMLLHLVQRPGCLGVASAWLAKWHVLRTVQGWSSDASADAALALDLVQTSLQDDSRDALALSIGGLVHAYLRKDLRVAGAMYDEAIDANPSEPLAWLFSATRWAYLGDGAKAEAAGERALRLSPIDPLKYFFDSLAATAALANGQWARSETLCRRSLRANRSHASTWRTLAFALVMEGRMDEAREAVQQLLAIEPGFTVGRFRERFPGRDGPMASPWAEALKTAGLPA